VLVGFDVRLLFAFLKFLIDTKVTGEFVQHCGLCRQTCAAAIGVTSVSNSTAILVRARLVDLFHGLLLGREGRDIYFEEAPVKSTWRLFSEVRGLRERLGKLMAANRVILDNNTQINTRRGSGFFESTVISLWT
jgi:hypothetical protein